VSSGVVFGAQLFAAMFKYDGTIRSTGSRDVRTGACWPFVPMGRHDEGQRPGAEGEAGGGVAGRAGPDELARALRHSGLGPLALPAVVGLSTLLHWLAGRRIGGLWIMPDEAIYAQRALLFWHQGSLPLLHGEGAGYGVLYPILAGVPLAAGSFVHGYASLKLLQAFVVSLAAVPVFAYGRRLMPPAYALLAAALTVASPLLLYSGLVMTEVLFYPLAALALLQTTRAVETALQRDQWLALLAIAAAVLTRVQAVVFVAVFAAAVLLDAALARNTRRLPRFWPVWLVVAASVALGLALPGLFGSYAGTLHGSYPLGHALGLVFDHASYLVLSTAVFPVLALLLLLLRPPAAAGRALVAVTASAAVLVLLQVGFFAARYSPHLLGRDLASLPPLLFLTFALWLSRGAPRGLVRTSACTFALLCLLLLAPWDRLVAPVALPDTFDLALLSQLHARPATVVAIAAPILLAAAVLLPRGLIALLPTFALALLVTSSVVGSNKIAASASAAQANIVGSPANWIDRAAVGPVAYVYAGERSWNTVWEERFWNRRIDTVLSLSPATVPGPIPERKVAVGSSGALPIRERYVVASDPLTFFGTPIGHLAQTGLEVSGLTLWRLEGRPRLATVLLNVQPNGDMIGPATLNVYDCRRGTLELTLLPKVSRVVRVLLDGRPVVRANVAGLQVWHGSISAHPSSRSRLCRFTIAGGTLLGSTRIAFVR
jgi:Dolichyl-phosphate-mannose-protein mannosyltransferase